MKHDEKQQYKSPYKKGGHNRTNDTYKSRCKAICANGTHYWRLKKGKQNDTTN